MSDFRTQRTNNGGGSELRTMVCRGRPDSLLSSRGAAYVGTTLGEWFVVRSETDVIALPSLAPHATAQIAGDTAAVALFEPMIALLEGEAWRYITCEAPILAMTRDDDALIVGDTHGNLTRRNIHGDAARLLLAGRGPIVDVLATRNAVAFIDGHLGAFQRTDDDLPAARYIDTGVLGRPFRLFAMHDRGSIGVAGATMLRAFDPATNELGPPSDAFEGGIRQLFAMRGSSDYALVTDDGELWLLDGTWQRRSVRLPQTAGDVVAAAPLEDGSLLAWTTTGQLFRKNRRGTTTLERRADVTLASAFRDVALSIEWQADSGARFDLLWFRDN